MYKTTLYSNLFQFSVDRQLGWAWKPPIIWPDHDPKKFTTILDQHVKEQPDPYPSTHGREKGRLTLSTNRETPCSYGRGHEIRDLGCFKCSNKDYEQPYPGLLSLVTPRHTLDQGR